MSSPSLSRNVGHHLHHRPDEQEQDQSGGTWMNPDLFQNVASSIPGIEGTEGRTALPGHLIPLHGFIQPPLAHVSRIATPSQWTPPDANDPNLWQPHEVWNTLDQNVGMQDFPVRNQAPQSPESE
ncbi:uncharacterized protein N7482_006640 [Penicillium canariense]|uniref:Uncharacterized protein n=1 Tax=Penicillium canariense TaxID=189055 RepID=A0A9W9HXY8_9EURO|nr:uncharacterized protein N7482_006640 [Penicillium canariense]KAJ5159636.1 hypothetical protein N7482_006640 [Penicillium canariense]